MENSHTASRPFEILLVEDREEDAQLAQYAFRGVPVDFTLHIVEDGIEALEFLRKKAPYNDAPLPDVILLDLNMPRMDGRELLAELKRDDNLKLIPAIVLTTSSAPDDVRFAYRSQAAAFITKPYELDKFSQIIKDFADFWFSAEARLPSIPARW